MNKAFMKNYAMQCTMVAFSLVVYGIGLFMVTDALSWTLGIVLGLLIALLKLKLMENTFTKAVNLPEAKAKGYTQRQYMLRYVLTGIVLLVAALNKDVSLLGAFFGLVSMKVGAYVQLGLK